LYAVEPADEGLRLRLRFPTADYEDEYKAARQYLPDEWLLERQTVAALGRGEVADGPLADLIRRRVIIDLPKQYY
jgi:hypothetical protein